MTQQSTQTAAPASRHRAFLEAFRVAAREKRLTPELMALRCLVLSKPLAHGFSPVTNATKLANGARPWHALEVALQPLTSMRRLEAHAGIQKLLAGLGFDLQAISVDAIREAGQPEVWSADHAARVLTRKNVDPK